MSTQTPDSSETLDAAIQECMSHLDVDFGYAVGNLNMDTTPESRADIIEKFKACIETAVQQASKALLELLEDKLLDKAIALTNEDTAVLWDDVVDVLERQQAGKDKEDDN